MTNVDDPAIERPRMDADVVCVGFGPASGGFLTTLSRAILNEDGSTAIESPSAPGLPLQVLCYERADDLGFGVSGVVTRARGIRERFPDLDPAQIPMAAPVSDEKFLYLLDPVGASCRPALMRVADVAIRAMGGVLGVKDDAMELPWTPDFLAKHGGLVLSIGQFNQWVGQQVMGSGAVQIWPASPVGDVLVEKDGVVGVRLVDQGVTKDGKPTEGFTPGMDVHAGLTVVADGPVGPIGRQLDKAFGIPEGHHTRDWAIGMKFVVDLPESCELEPGTVIHTLGYPEPEIFGFFYVHPDRVASMGIFVPSWFDSPARNAYKYLQHWMLHPAIWRHVKGGRLRSWGAKTLQESGRRGEPRLAGKGFARIGEGSGSTNVLTNSGVDEAWTTGVMLAEGILELLKNKQPFTAENLEAAYVNRRRKSWVDKEGRVAERARDGFQRGIIPGLIGMMATGLTKGFLSLPGKSVPPHRRVPTFEDYYRGRITPEEIQAIRKESDAKGVSAHAALMERAGWPAISFDGELLISHQDALLLGGKVQAPAGYADHVEFIYPRDCESCGSKICIEMCSGQAIFPGENGRPAFDREKCVYCGACLWNCSKGNPKDSEKGLIEFHAGAGGLHSAEN